MPTFDEILRVKNSLADRLFSQDAKPSAPPGPGWLKRNITGLGPGLRIKNGVVTGVLFLSFFVRVKVERDDLPERFDLRRSNYLKELWGDMPDDLPVDVVETGRIQSLGSSEEGLLVTSRLRPVTPLAIGADLAMAGRATHGTLCAFGWDKNRRPSLISCGHVLDSHGDMFHLVVSKDEVVAKIPAQSQATTQDAALAILQRDIAPDFDLPGGFGRLSSADPYDVKRETDVEKAGKSIADGKVVNFDAKISVDYPNQTVYLDHQLLVYKRHGMFAQPGDSGSLVITIRDKQTLPVGMVVAAGDVATLLPKHARLPPTFTVVSPLRAVLDSLSATLRIA